MMHFWTVLLYLAIGFGCGLFYFAGLWWTIRRLTRAGRPALWTLASFLLRTVIVLLVFYVTSQGHWDRILICLAGFMIARLLLLRRIAPRTTDKGSPAATAAGMPTSRGK